MSHHFGLSLIAVLLLPGARVHADLVHADPVHTDPEMVFIPAGTFMMGSSAGEPDERPPHKVRLGAYQIDRYEVTRERYWRCVSAGACGEPRKIKGPKGSRLPVVGVSWIDAMKFCKWSGKRLPTEAEWERVASGVEARRFPWGKAASCEKANFGNFKGAGLCAGKNPGEIIKVGSRPAGASPEGVQDMAGNVWEWVSDLHRPYPYRQQADPGQGRAPGKKLRVVRGGSCCSYFAMPTTTNRLSFPPDYADFDIGFRCAR